MLACHHTQKEGSWLGLILACPLKCAIAVAAINCNKNHGGKNNEVTMKCDECEISIVVNPRWPLWGYSTKGADTNVKFWCW